jgi:hypothetical protein
MKFGNLFYPPLLGLDRETKSINIEEDKRTNMNRVFGGNAEENKVYIVEASQGIRHLTKPFV